MPKERGRKENQIEYGTLNSFWKFEKREASVRVKLMWRTPAVGRLFVTTTNTVGLPLVCIYTHTQ
jgi:hypothetical protein